MEGPAGAKLAERLIGHAQWVLRDMTAPWFNTAANAPVRRELVRQWQTLRDRQWAEGQAASYLSEHFGRELLAQLGFSQEEIDRFDTEVWLGNRRLAAGAGERGATRLSLDLDRPSMLPSSRSCASDDPADCSPPGQKTPPPAACPDGSAPPCTGPSTISCPDGSAPPCGDPGGGGAGVQARPASDGNGHESGVSMTMEVKEESFRKEESDELAALREAAKCRQTGADKTPSCRPESEEAPDESPPPPRP